MVFTGTLLYFLLKNYKNKLDKKIEELETSNQKLADERSKIQEINEQLEYFADSASHDLKSPLRTISLLTDRFRKKFSDDLSEDAKEYLEIIIESSKELTTKIDETLRFSKIDHLKETFETVKTEEVVHKVIADLKTDIDEKGATIQVENLPDIKSSRQLVHKIFQNLIDNSIKYSKENTKPEIVIGYKSIKKEYWTFFVKDNGLGIECSEQDKVFERYHRSDENSKNGGSGIGLSIVSQIITRLKGKVWIESKLGEGTEIYFSLPR